jgi:hypothetical protein
MRVALGTVEYTLYVGSDGEWTMHEYVQSAFNSECYVWVRSVLNVNERDPFKGSDSRVEYDAWG